MPRISRFKLRDSDRSGFTHKELTLLKDGPWKVAGDEYDVPPPSRRSLGGEGDMTASGILEGHDYQIEDVATPAAYDHPTVYVTAADGITPSWVHPWMAVSGSNGVVDIVANPQIATATEGAQLTLVCVDSGIILDHGDGLSLMGGQRFSMSSGSIISFLFTTGANLWHETSRTR